MYNLLFDSNRFVKGLALFAIGFFIAISLACSDVRYFTSILPVVNVDPKQNDLNRAQNDFIMARDYDRRGLPDMALYFYESSYRLDPNSTELRNIVLGKYLLGKKYRKALLLIKNGRAISDLSDDELRLLSGFYSELKEFLSAIEALELVRKKSSTEFCQLAVFYDRLNRTSDAIGALELCVEADVQSLHYRKRLAQLYVKDGKYEKAESLYVKLDSAGSNKSDIMTSLGIINLLKKDTLEAFNFFKMALLIDSTSVEAITTIAQLHLLRKEYGEAIRYYEKISTDDYLTNKYNRRMLAMLYYYDAQFDKSEQLISGMLIEDTTDYELHYYLGMVYESQDKNDLALLEYQKSIDISNSFEDAWERICFILLREEKYGLAVETAEEFTNKRSESSSSWKLLGYVLNITKQYKDAIIALEKAITFGEFDADLNFELAGAYERVGDYKRAVKVFTIILKKDPEHSVAANYLGYMWANRGKNLKEAKVLIERALKKKPSNGAYLDSYAWVFYKMGDYAEAERIIILALENMNDDPVIFEHFGDILVKRKKHSEAIKAYEKSLLMNPENREFVQMKLDALISSTGTE